MIEYTKVEPGPNNTSLVYIAVSKGYNNFTSADTDTAITQNVEAFLNSFVKDADNHYADVDINNQVKEVAKSEKEYQKLLDEQKELLDKKVKLEERLAAIQIDLSNSKLALDKQRSGVEELKSKRADSNNR